MQGSVPELRSGPGVWPAPAWPVLACAPSSSAAAGCGLLGQAVVTARPLILTSARRLMGLSLLLLLSPDLHDLLEARIEDGAHFEQVVRGGAAAQAVRAIVDPTPGSVLL